MVDGGASFWLAIVAGLWVVGRCDVFVDAIGTVVVGGRANAQGIDQKSELEAQRSAVAAW